MIGRISQAGELTGEGRKIELFLMERPKKLRNSL